MDFCCSKRLKGFQMIILKGGQPVYTYTDQANEPADKTELKVPPGTIGNVVKI